MTKGYVVIIEGEPGSYSAYLPELPGCIATGQTIDQVEQRMRVAIAMHINGMLEDGLPIPEPSAVAALVQTA